VTDKSVPNWSPGFPCKLILPNKTKRLWIEKLWPCFQEMLFEDDNEEVVTNVCESLSRLLDECGPDLLSHVFDANDPHKMLLSAIYKLLQGQHPCQPFNRGQIDEDEESRAMEECLFDGLSALIASIASCLGPQFQPLFEQMNTSILKLAKHKKSAAYRCIGLGCFAEVIKAMKSSAAPYVEALIKPALDGIRQSDDIDLRVNATLCMGIIIEVSPTNSAVQGVVMDILEALNPIFDAALNHTQLQGVRKDEDWLIDNAAACVGRMVMSLSSNALPLQSIVPVFLKVLPLRTDPEEAPTVMKCLLHLYNGGIPKELLEANIEGLINASVSQLVHSTSQGLTKDLYERVHNMNKTLLQQLSQNSSSQPLLLNLQTSFSSNHKALNYLKSIIFQQ